MPNLEGQLGELTGHLRALVPALEKVENRQNNADQKAAGMEAKLEGIRHEFNELKLKVSNRIGEHYKSINELDKLLKGLENEIGDRKTEIEGCALKTEVVACETRVAALEAKSDGTKQKIWDVVKILITAVLTLIGSKVLGKL